jgi:hypothetical protein
MNRVKLFAVLTLALFVWFGVAEAAKTLIDGITVKHSGSQTYPQTAGVYVGGAKGMIIYIDWTTWAAGGFGLQPIFAQSKTDSGASYYSCTWADSISVTNPRSSGATGSFSIRLVDDGIYPAGYMFLRIFPYANCNITGLTAKVELVY